MRFVFLIPDLKNGWAWRKLISTFYYSGSEKLFEYSVNRWFLIDEVFGGTLNIMRHCWVARENGIDAVLATMSGYNSYGDIFGIDRQIPFIPWKQRKIDDVCIVPDFASCIIKNIEGYSISYQQSPLHANPDFNYGNDEVSIWTDSELMEEICLEKFPGKHIEIVPNVVDNELFPFIPQHEREEGLIFAFPRKGANFISEVKELYYKNGGQYWTFELVDGLPLSELAKQFRRPQAFLASAEYEGCALPPQEAMAAGVVVVGKNARGANFCMQNGITSLNGDTAVEVVECLFRLEQEKLREKLAENAYNYIQKFFPGGEPKEFWNRVFSEYDSKLQSLDVLV